MWVVGRRGIGIGDNYIKDFSNNQVVNILLVSVSEEAW